MIKISSFRPEHFNNNGDQGNIEALSYSLNAQQIEHQVVDQIAQEDDFVLIGDASIAAINHYEGELLDLVQLLTSRLASGRATLLIGRSYELLAPQLGIELQFGSRRSEFMKVSTEFGDVIGYHNSELVEPRFFSNGNFFGTTLFGPVLAKNPQLLKRLASVLSYEGELQQWQLDFPAEIAARTTFG
ncbi:MAG: hypothetical protein K9G13_01130 [Aquiluna sp.]|nr:hypothetical protein [Aquiluna sp.]MCF8545135.1 hypothetical protein [Aquiluna sp.]